ncbi:MAG: tRNA-uridine aminocarboxypropyltransferase [Campylobacterota bacterium]|nr:tRNA-uridine aminocarboxypropyltransferase [Campylobacterota bacterium]
MAKNRSSLENREKCYNCYRPKSSCMCQYINKVDTKTQFIILMHPKEFKKTKNGTGHFTHLTLSNSKIFIGIDFNNHAEINNILNDHTKNCYVMYPSDNSIKLNTQTISKNDKQNVIFIIDSTWPCSRKILAVSKNIQKLQKVSFLHNKSSQFKIKTQPNEFSLSTIESTLCILELLNNHKIETIEKKNLDNFLQPFEKMVEYQVSCAISSNGRKPRFLRRENI